MRITQKGMRIILVSMRTTQMTMRTDAHQTKLLNMIRAISVRVYSCPLSSNTKDHLNSKKIGKIKQNTVESKWESDWSEPSVYAYANVLFDTEKKRCWPARYISKVHRIRSDTIGRHNSKKIAKSSTIKPRWNENLTSAYASRQTSATIRKTTIAMNQQKSAKIKTIP
jgi:hypothetical protein